MQKFKEKLSDVVKWWRGVTNDEIYGLLMRWASAVTAITLVITTIIVIIRGVACACSRKK